MFHPARLSLELSAFLIWLFCLSAAYPSYVFAVTVPDDYPTIQAALDDLKYGDLPSGEVIEVRPGTYDEALTYAESPKSFTLKSIDGADQTIINATGTGRSAVFIRDTTATITIEGFTITGGESATDGGLSFKNVPVNVRDCIVQGNYGYHGGGLHLFASNTTIENSIFRDNVASKSAGGIAIVAGSVATIVDSKVINNVAGAIDSIASGGGIRVGNSSLVIRRSIISGNQAKFAGGGIFAIGEFDDPFGVTTVTIEDSLIANNQVVHDQGFPIGAGGGVHIEANALALVVDSIVTDNFCSGKGGGLNTFQARYEIIGTLIEFNQALAGTGGGIHGFSQSPAGSSLLITDSVVRNNTALNSGGISLSGNGCRLGGVCADLQMERALVDSNAAPNFGGGINIDNAVASVYDSHILRNQAIDSVNGAGGGLRLTASSVEIGLTSILGNSAGLTGGGVFVGSNTDVNINASTIQFNHVAQADKGGGLHTSSAGPPLGTVSNTIIADNAGFQIREQSCPPDLPAPILTYLGNNVTNQPLNSLYVSPCQPEEIHDINEFNGLSPGFKTVDNFDSTPVFSDLSAISLPWGRNVISWAQTGVENVEIVNLGLFPGAFGTVDVFPACTKTYMLGTDSVTITGSSAAVLEISKRQFRTAEIIEASQIISATESVVKSGASATLKAGESIALGQSFVVEAGASLHLRIDPEMCP